ncbi:hypothetical protein ACFY0G_39895 [Streptomyces sp. NPDC001552]|uniref:hypothetical protein n=1 Tax=Streptomyces sp. NPDC001552 TaxID=3364587 RepID=UPI00369A1E5D
MGSTLHESGQVGPVLGMGAVEVFLQLEEVMGKAFSPFTSESQFGSTLEGESTLRFMTPPRWRRRANTWKNWTGQAGTPP